jgi:hypothetical protein
MTSEAQKRAVAKYKQKTPTKKVTIEFFPSDMELYNHLQSQDKKQTYIKNLIKADMEKGK